MINNLNKEFYKQFKTEADLERYLIEEAFLDYKTARLIIKQIKLG